jgi:hypothetical protein
MAHRQRVMHLYRQALKTCLDWSGDRRQWYPRARAIRSEFESNRSLVRDAGVDGECWAQGGRGCAASAGAAAAESLQWAVLLLLLLRAAAAGGKPCTAACPPPSAK